MTDLSELASVIRDAMQTLPANDRLWSKTRIGEYFDVSEATVDRAIVSKPDFPQPVKVQGGPLRWVAREVIEWAENQRGRRRQRR